jgi:hypothetical protein
MAGCYQFGLELGTIAAAAHFLGGTGSRQTSISKAVLSALGILKIIWIPYQRLIPHSIAAVTRPRVRVTDQTCVPSCLPFHLSGYYSQIYNGCKWRWIGEKTAALLAGSNYQR